MFRPDQPMQSGKEDILGRHAFSKALANAICSYEVPLADKQEIERLLFSQLDQLIKDIPEEQWDQVYWGNIYHSGLKHFFATIRDVTRYINSLRLSFDMVKGEVNAIDFNVSAFITDIVQTDDGLVDFISSFLSKSISHGMSDYVGRFHWKMPLDSIKRFIDPESIKDRLREISQRDDFNRLPEEKRKAARLFLDTIDGKIKKADWDD